ncbi:expressed unknown protein [Seminavis robusta]|uniref:Uncharacterized protein n=1 Tax=Seminavis robusta TaxID=568900 RepID=A0A9N8H7P9_9STRA|nr:expressed unknown protein [Seminavis robusta]|eukprot:Sro135_g063880.1 n/a (476) ;mRNA; r:88307-89811
MMIASKKVGTVVVGLLLALCGVVVLLEKMRAHTDQLAKEALGQLLSHLVENSDDFGVAGERRLQTVDVPCNTLIDTLSIADIREVAAALLRERLAAPEAVILTLDTLVLSQLKYDVQLWKVCGRCSDFDDDALYPKNVGCRPQDYGFHAMHSGLLVAPYDVTTGELLHSTLPVTILPSYSFFPPSNVRPPLTTVNDHPAIVGIMLSSVSISYALLPDDIGWVESGDYYRGFMLKQSIITSLVPLIWQSEAIVSEQSDCTSAMADAYFITGYSQSGYGAVVLGDALHRMGKNVVAVRAGGAPYRMSSETVSHFIANARNEKPPLTYYFMPLLAAGLSTTNTDAKNYGAGQDLLADEYRDTWIAEAQRPMMHAEGVKRMIPDGDPLKIYNPAFVNLVQQGNARNDTNPCVTSVTNETDKLCAALQDLDLIGEVERAEYPLYLCHARGDYDIPFANVPDASINPNYAACVHAKFVEAS